MYKHLQLQDRPKFTRIAIFGLKIYHLTTLHYPPFPYFSLNLRTNTNSGLFLSYCSLSRGQHFMQLEASDHPDGDQVRVQHVLRRHQVVPDLRRTQSRRKGLVSGIFNNFSMFRQHLSKIRSR
jgi:hypothetical protein